MVNQDQTINLTFVAFARRRGLDVTIEYNEDGNQVWIWDLENECEPLLMYNVNTDNTLHYKANLFNDLEDLPLWLEHKRAMYKLLDYVADMLKASKMP